MRYHNITHDDMLNGDGLRVVLWVSGCTHKCQGCQNPITWNPDDGLEFDIAAKNEIFNELKKDYVSGITFSGGDPFYIGNIDAVTKFIHDIKMSYPSKTVWVYTGYQYEYLLDNLYYSLINIDVLVDGKFIKELSDVNYRWAGSTNQRAIDVQESLKQEDIVLWK
jgi:anaerobic ribonucleoside-triphosphate reductase activating protein